MSGSLNDPQRDEQDAAVIFYMDEDFDRYADRRAWRPSDLFRIGYLVMWSNGSRDAVRKAEAWREDVITEARRRWSAGFYANPFTIDPIERCR